ncbi:MAG: hypothetical protein ACI9XP_001644 [Lentimonas sp.]|jgi:hypothetical protein
MFTTDSLREQFKGFTPEILKQVNDSLQIIYFSPDENKDCSILMTNGLSDVFMPVHEKHKGEERMELYFCLPSYWDINDPANNFQWPLIWLEKLAKHVIEKNTWFGIGHTVQCYKDYAPLSENMSQSHFILNRPDYCSEMLPELIHENGETIQFLAIIPIFSDEMDYKQGKGTLKLFKKLLNKNITEKLDDFRNSVLKSRFSFFSRRSK